MGTGNKKNRNEFEKSQKFALIGFIGFGLWILNACVSAPPIPEAAHYRSSKSPSEISVMTFNVENLFDIKKDSGKFDQTYLPLSEKQRLGINELCAQDMRKEECKNTDWNEHALDIKMKNITQVVLGVESGQGPDILILPEVENIGVLKEWNSKYLAQGKYQTVVLIEGPDPRGIDVGILSRLPLGGQPELIEVPSFKTRGILKTPLKLGNGSVVVVYGVHLPSQANPVSQRREVLQLLKNDIKKDGRPFIIGGDFNITTAEENKEHLIRDMLQPIAAVSHFVGCQTCQGTHYYRHGWSFLDIILVSNSLKNETGYSLQPDSIEVVKERVHTTKIGTPFRFDSNELQGVSDHFPLYLKLSKGSEAQKSSQIR